jgi:hypothetical protein
MKKVQLLIVVLFLSFVECSSSTPTPKNPNSMPAWVITPSMDGWIEIQMNSIFGWYSINN